MAHHGHPHGHSNHHHHHHHGGGGSSSAGGGPRLLAGPNLDAFGAIIAGDRMPKGEINVETRAAIIAAVQAGEKKKSIARRFGISNASINRTLDRFEKTGQLTSRPRPGRPRSKPAPSRPTDPTARRRSGPPRSLNLPRVLVGPPVHANPAAPATFLSPQQDRSLTRLLATMTVTLHPTTYVYCSFTDPSRLPPMPQIQLFFQEPGGITIVTSMGYARAHNLPYLSPCKMLTLAVTAELSALGLMPMVEARLAAAGMCANTVSGYLRDHLFVPVGREHEAVRILTAMAEEKRREASIVEGQFPPVPVYVPPASTTPEGSVPPASADVPPISGFLRARIGGSETPSFDKDADSDDSHAMSEPLTVEESSDEADPIPSGPEVDADEAAAESQVLAETRAAAATQALEEQEQNAARSPSLGAGSRSEAGEDSVSEPLEALRNAAMQLDHS
ncbi:ACT domain-containing protein [Purpureocillium lilacinum]|uniref:ACT domain-containing protein n=1 Tax=Purpureocillium lilacinum TaxID=33203 RepID=A0A179GXY4_PURLI|nr:ACT domain-containing protein [Purpureocillium lilacinum]OAQ82642.1 ACT domain-containing protein [Purpureocillium lilacinum]